MNQTFFSRQDFNKYPIIFYALYFPFINFVGHDFPGQPYYFLNSSSHRCLVYRRNIDRSIILNVNICPGSCDYAFNCLSPGPDEFANLKWINLRYLYFGSKFGNLCTRFSECFEDHCHNLVPCCLCLLQGLLKYRYR
ncbi:MAG: hypothetical protein ACD_52C00218G0001 [uncultured bacterium]|nr:MAG: hypothetical protein ACD_52C00218G0001 [uncultured bacterium]